MTAKTWLAEFYPKPASKTTEEEAVGHSLQKWTGLKKENLEKHGLKVSPLSMGGDTCALCYQYIDDESHWQCDRCPLYQSLGRTCDDSDLGTSPWHSWIQDKDPEPMIAALERVQNETSN